MSTGAYILVKFNDREKLLPAVATVGGLPDVSKWDAVDGHHDLVIKMVTENPSSIKKIQKLDGFSELVSCTLESPPDSEVSLSEEHSYSYLFIETERYQQNAVQSHLEKNDAIVFCAPAKGGCDLVALVKGENFDRIDRMVNNDIRQLDGVLRMKQDRIILLDRM